MKIAVLLGAPGTGKGTQAKRLIPFGFKHYSTGDMLRQAIKEGSALGKEADRIIHKGELVPDPLMIQLIETTFAPLPKDTKVLLDGFPRTVPQAEALDNKPNTRVALALNFKVPEGHLIKRLTGRRTCKNCGSTFHVDFMAPQKEGRCDKCGSELVQREDDKAGVVQKRLDVFYKQTAPLIEYYNKQGVLKHINADREADEVEAELLEIFKPWSK